MSPEVRNYLDGKGVTFKTYAHAPIVSFEDAKAILPFDPGLMVKGLAFRLPSDAYAIVAMRATDRADYKKIADALGIRRADLKLAGADEIATDLGMMPGGVSPLPVNGARVLIDDSVLNLDAIFCGTGRTDTTLEIAARDLVRATGAMPADLVKAPARSE